MDKWLSHPTALKIISLVLGILLWAVVHFDSERSPNTVASLTETRIIDTVKVEAAGLDERNFALRVMEPQSVKLKVRGTRGDLFSASPEDYKMVVDVTGMEEGRHELPITVSRLPRNIELVSVTPHTVSVVLESMLTKEFEVKIKTEGAPAKGYKAGEPIVKPNNRVHVTLPEDRMNEVGSVSAVVNIKDEEKTVTTKKAKVVVLDKNGNEMTEASVNPSVVEVEVPITMPFKQVPLQIGFTGKLPAGLAVASFKPSVEQVTIYGPQEALNKIDFYDGINVDLSKLTQSGTIDLNIPTVGNIEAVDPGKVTVQIEIVNSETMVLSQIPITIIGLSDPLKAKMILPSLGKQDITISGASSVLADIGAKDVQLIADLSGLGSGNHNVRLDVHLPRFVTLYSGNPTVTVEVSDGREVSVPPDDIPTDADPEGTGEPEGNGQTPPVGENNPQAGGSSGSNSGSGTGNGSADPNANGNAGGTNSGSNPSSNGGSGSTDAGSGSGGGPGNHGPGNGAGTGTGTPGNKDPNTSTGEEGSPGAGTNAGKPSDFTNSNNDGASQSTN